MDKKLIGMLNEIQGHGPVTWRFLCDQYCSNGSSRETFNKALMAAHDKWPDRLLIHRPYNISESPMIEVPPREGE